MFSETYRNFEKSQIFEKKLQNFKYLEKVSSVWKKLQNYQALEKNCRNLVILVNVLLLLI